MRVSPARLAVLRAATDHCQNALLEWEGTYLTKYDPCPGEAKHSIKYPETRRTTSLCDSCFEKWAAGERERTAIKSAVKAMLAQWVDYSDDPEGLDRAAASIGLAAYYTAFKVRGVGREVLAENEKETT